MIGGDAIGLLTIPEAADLAGVAPSTMRCWIHRYDIPHVRSIEGLTLVSERAVLDCERVRRHARRGRKRQVA